MPARTRRLAVSFLAGHLLILALVGSALAHDIPNARIERSTQIFLDRGRLQVEYEVTLAELTLAQDLRQVDGEGFVGDRAALFERYARVVGPLNARGFLITVDDREIDVRPVDFTIAVDDHPRLKFRFEADIPTGGRLSLADTNYSSSEGTTRLALKVGPGLRVEGDLPPSEVGSIPVRASWQMTDDDEKRSRRLVVRYASNASAASLPNPKVATPAKAVETARSGSSGLTRLLDHSTGATSAGWLVAAVLLGMIHAIQPGHGKTLVAAASLGGPHAARRGVWLGLITAACHLVGVVVVALILWSFRTERFAAIHIGIARASGFAIAAVGVHRAGRHLAGIGDDHQHRVRASAAGLWSLGLAAGFVPCWDAVALVVLAASIGQLGWGLVLLGAFSLGLAIVLVAVGWFAGQFHERIEAGRNLGRSRRWLGLASGVVLAAIGLGLLNTR